MPTRSPRNLALAACAALAACGGGDGGSDGDPRLPANEVVCAQLAAPASGACSVTPGAAGLLVQGDLLVPGRIYRGGGVAIDDVGTITCVGCDCAASAATATRIACPGAIVSPGLIDPHEHLTYAQSAPATDTGERYEDRHQWIHGLDGHAALTYVGGASARQQAWAELRHVMAGTTSLVGAGGGVQGLARNLDRSTMLEGVLAMALTTDTWPLGDVTPVGSVLAAPSCADFTDAVTTAEVSTRPAWLGHVAEGIAPYAAAELGCLSDANPGHDVLRPRTALVNAVGLDAAGWAKLGQTATKLVWSPRSNVRLYGTTSDAALADRLGVRIALGTDWIVTGSMNLLRELRCADAWNRDRLGGHFTDEQLWLMATRNAAEATGTEGFLGTLSTGKTADVAVYDGRVHRDHRAVIDADPQDVLLVLRGGTVLFGEANVVGALDPACDPVDVCGSAKRVCLQGQVGEGWTSLSAENATSYPAFACGTPEGEPTCDPSRPAAVAGSTIYTGAVTSDDADGDGIPAAQDGCPGAFDPIRPMDGGAQRDVDGDGAPDACDACPMEAGATTCTAPDPDDVDADGAPNDADNCPFTANADQADQDSDAKGDACDPCPAGYNPGPNACPATIYQVKDGTIPIGTEVSIQDVLVTGRAGEGYFVQVTSGSAAYAGPDRSGIFVYDPANAVSVGDQITIGRATTVDFMGQVQLTSPTSVMPLSSGNSPPAPVAVTAAEVATGGARAAALEGVVVRVSSVTVTDTSPSATPGDPTPGDEFVVDGVLRVDALLHQLWPWPVLDQPFASITGVLAWRHGASKLEPRDAADFDLGPTRLVAFGPDGFAFEGQVAATTSPLPLLVEVYPPPEADLFIAITSSDASALTVVGGGVTVPAGQAGAVVQLNGHAASASVTLTASLGMVGTTARVRVVGATEQPAVVSLTPAAPTVAAWATQPMTVTLDIPPPPTGSATVGLSLDPVDAGTIPATVTVGGGRTAATFDYVDQGAGGFATLTATLGGSSATAEIASVPPGRFVINEIDYDNVGTDSAEFVELFNGTAAPIDLSAYAIVLVNGATGQEYARWPLAGTLAAGQYLVAGATGVVGALPVGAIGLDEGALGNLIQNGDPDGVALVDTVSNSLVDALSYDGSIVLAQLTGFPNLVSLVEGIAAQASDSSLEERSLCRLPNGQDTDVANGDWSNCPTPTPGADNTP